MANYSRTAKPYSKPLEKKIHYTPQELDALEEKARGLSRMDWVDKVKLIQGNRRALDLEAANARMREAIASESLDSYTRLMAVAEILASVRPEATGGPR